MSDDDGASLSERGKEEGWVKVPHFREVGKDEEDGDGEGVQDNESSSGQGKEDGWVAAPRRHEVGEGEGVDNDVSSASSSSHSR